MRMNLIEVANGRPRRETRPRYLAGFAPNGDWAERDVKNAPADCDDGGGVVNTPPTANDDAYNATSGVTLNVAAPGVLGNDTDDGLLSQLVVSAVISDVSNGSLTLNADGSFTYLSNSTSDVVDSFTYEVSDGEFTAQATVTITVTAAPPVNTPPTANDDAYNATSGVALNVAAPGVLGNDTDDGLLSPLVVSNLVTDTASGTLSLNADGSFSYTSVAGFEGNDSFTYEVSDGEFTAQATATITVTAVLADPQCSDGIDNDGDTLIDFPADPGCIDANDDDETDAPPVAQCSDGIDNDGDGLIDFPADPGCYIATDNDETDPPAFADQTDFKIMMNYELGMHCTGFEFAYCCVLPAYNSILAQVVKPDATGQGHPELMAGDPNAGLDALGRQTVVRDRAQDGNGNFKKYVLKYWHDAQPRNDGRGKPQSPNRLISAEEGNSLMSWNTSFDSAALNPDGSFVIGGLNADGTPNPATEYNGSRGVVLGDGIVNAADNYQNAVWNHLYFYDNLEGGNVAGSSLEADKTRLGVNGHVVYPTDCGPALHPMGPVTTDPNDPTKTIANDCAGFSNGNVLTFSGEHGTVVYTQMKVLENLPVMLTSPDIWEALGLPLTPFEDSIDFFGDPGLLNEDSVRPFVAMNAQMFDYDPAAPGGAGAATLDSGNNPIIGFGTAPIDIPNCERCHSNPVDGTMIDNAANEGGGQLMVINSPNADPAQYAMVQAEYEYWNAYYNIDKAAGDSDWYSRLKSAAISMLNGHDIQHGTSFAANYPGTEVTGVAPQNTRLGHESVICQRCHADNVIAAVKSAECGAGSELGTEKCLAGTLIMPITEAIHKNHGGISTGGPIAFDDSLGRDGGCQGCHPAHRSDGDMNGYPITLAGANKYADGDNRGASGGCFVGRDVHSNPGKDSDGAETPEHLNAVGRYLADNVANDGMGIWCTNCHNQLGQELWKAENMDSLVHGVGANNPRAGATLADVAAAVGVSEDQAIAWLDPTTTNPLGDFSRAIWDADPGLCNYVAGYFGVIPVDTAHDGNVATVEVNVSSAAACSTGGGSELIDCGAPYPGAPAFHICGTVDGDGDFSVNALDFCTTPDCVTAAGAGLPAGSVAVPVPMSAATDGRDHWLSPGEPHCADCHEAPFVEQSGNINAYTPFNYPRKASLMRYSKGHQNISCQGCHESIHGLYPVTPNIDTTSYAQAKALNHDNTAGPLKCGTCHDVDNQGIPSFMNTNRSVYSVPGYGGAGINSFDEAVAWAHIYTEEQSVLDTTCQNCHGVQGTNWSDMGSYTNPDGKFVEHAMDGRGSRQMQDKAEIERWGAVLTSSNGANGVCTDCHGNEASNVSCNDSEWQLHLTEGRVAAETFEKISTILTGGSCW